MSRFVTGGCVVFSLLMLLVAVVAAFSINAEEPTLAGPHDEHADAGRAEPPVGAVHANWLDDLISRMEGEDDAGAPPPSATPDAGSEEETEIEFQDDVDTHSVMALRGALETASTYRIRIVINTAGGDTDEMLIAARAIEHATKSHEVVCTVDGEAASAGFFILQSCPRREMTARSALMAHEPYISALAYITRNKLKSQGSHLDTLLGQYAAQATARMKISTAEFRRRIAGRDWWLDPAEALRTGAVDAVVPSPNTPSPKHADAGPADAGTAD